MNIKINTRGWKIPVSSDLIIVATILLLFAALSTSCDFLGITSGDDEGGAIWAVQLASSIDNMANMPDGNVCVYSSSEFNIILDHGSPLHSSDISIPLNCDNIVAVIGTLDGRSLLIAGTYQMGDTLTGLRLAKMDYYGNVEFTSELEGWTTSYVYNDGEYNCITYFSITGAKLVELPDQSGFEAMIQTRMEGSEDCDGPDSRYVVYHVEISGDGEFSSLRQNGNVRIGLYAKTDNGNTWILGTGNGEYILSFGYLYDTEGNKLGGWECDSPLSAVGCLIPSGEMMMVWWKDIWLYDNMANIVKHVSIDHYGYVITCGESNGYFWIFHRFSRDLQYLRFFDQTGETVFEETFDTDITIEGSTNSIAGGAKALFINGDNHSLIKFRMN